MAAGRTDHYREADGGAQHGRLQLTLGHVPQKARAQAHGVEGRAIPLGGQFVLRATGDKIPVIVWQDLLGARFVIIQTSRF